MRKRDVDDTQPRAAGGALAGLLCKLDRRYGAWCDLDQPELALNRSLLPVVKVDAEQLSSLVRAGLNVVAMGPAGQSRLYGSVTLRRDSDAQRQFVSLSVRRLCLQVLKTIEEATRWAVFEPQSLRLGDRVRAQVKAYLACLANLDAFEDDQFFVECDAGLRKPEEGVEHGFAVFVAFHPRHCKESVSFTLHQTAAGCRVASTAFVPTGMGLDSPLI